MDHNILDISEQQFETTVLQAPYDRLVVVDFWAPWCAPCRTLIPILEQVAAAHRESLLLVKINIDENQKLAGQLQVRSVPTVKLFRAGQLVDEFMGALPRAEVERYVARHLPKPADALRREAAVSMREQQAGAAATLLRQARELEPENGEIRLELAQAEAFLGNQQVALELLATLPPALRQDARAEALEAALKLALEADSGVDPEALAKKIEAEPDNLDNRWALALHQAAAGNYDSGLTQLLEIVSRQRDYRDGDARRKILEIFKVCPDDGVVRHYRRRLASALN